MKRKKQPYLSYLLRLWPVSTKNSQPWRASLENVATGERQGFSDLEALFGYLYQVAKGEETTRIRSSDDKEKGGGR